MYNKLKGSNQAGCIRIVIILLISFCLASVGCSPQVVNSPEETVTPTVEPWWMEALKDEDFSVRMRAAQALGESRDARAVEPLIATLKDEDFSVRMFAAEALGKIMDARAVEPLIAALKDENFSVRWKVAEALGKIRDARAVEPLIEALRDEDAFVRIYVVNALREIGTPAVEPLIEALKDEDARVRMGAAEALGRIKDILAVEPLIAVLMDQDPGVRGKAAIALGIIKDARAVEPLMEALKDEGLEIIAGAHRFFIERGEEGSEAVLIKSLNEYGFSEMAEDFLNCGNNLLAEGGNEWANSHDYRIMQLPGGGGGGPKWGSGQ